MVTQNTFSCAAQSVYHIRVRATEGDLTGETSLAIKITSNPAVVSLGSNVSVMEGDIFTSNGSFTDPYSLQWVGTVDYGDGSGFQPLALNPDKTFQLTHVYGQAGTFDVLVSITNDEGGVGTGTLDVTVSDPSLSSSTDVPAWESPIPADSPSNRLSGQAFVLSSGYIVDPTVPFVLPTGIATV